MGFKCWVSVDDSDRFASPLPKKVTRILDEVRHLRYSAEGSEDGGLLRREYDGDPGDVQACCPMFFSNSELERIFSNF